MGSWRTVFVSTPLTHQRQKLFQVYVLWLVTELLHDAFVNKPNHWVRELIESHAMTRQKLLLAYLNPKELGENGALQPQVQLVPVKGLWMALECIAQVQAHSDFGGLHR